MPRKIIRIVLALFAACVVLVLIAGGLRYGPQGLARRVQSELGLAKAHPALVPTPLAATDAIGTSSELAVRANAQSPTVAATAPSSLETPDAPDTAQDAITNTLAISAADSGASAVAVEPTVPSTSAPTLTPTPLPHRTASAFATLSGFHHEWQTWNNCGPATLGMQMSYFGSTLRQDVIGGQLRSHEDDKNVLPSELVAFARAQGYHAHAFVNGDSQRLKLLLSNGVPVLVETWLEEDPNDGMGHYRLLTGYDDAAQHWISYDSYLSHNLVNSDPSAYAGVTVPYGELEPLWQVFNRTYLLVYTDEFAPIVESIVGEDMDETAMWQRSLATAQAATAAHPEDAYAWFNLGSSQTALGDYAGAAASFDRARVLGLPWRMLWYQFGPFEAYFRTGRYEEIVALADATIATTRSVEELFFWKGHALAALGQLDGARAAWQQAVQLNPTYDEALAALGAVGG